MKAALALADWIDSVNEWVGRTVSYLILGVVGVTFAVAVLRYGFSVGWVWMQELSDWLHATVFMTAVGYTLLHDGHARVDVFYRPAKPHTKAIIDLGGCLLFVLPSISLLFYHSIPYVVRAWERLETSKEAGGLPGLFLLKSMIPAFCILLILQAISVVVRSLADLRNGEGGRFAATLPREEGDSGDGIK